MGGRRGARAALEGVGAQVRAHAEVVARPDTRALVVAHHAARLDEPAPVAERFCLVPVYVRQVRRQGRTLFVAMEDPMSLDALQAAADCSGLPVKPTVAAPTDIRNAIRVYYLGLPPAARAESEPAEAIDIVEEIFDEAVRDTVVAPEP